MGELKDWMGDDMTQWTEYRVNMAEELEQRCIDRWDELWKFNGGVEPKFWFGDRVIYQGSLGAITAMDWRSASRPNLSLKKKGWFYVAIFAGGETQYIHEDDLEAIAQIEGEQCQGF